jgi:metal-responsive CopG/Arc/MetJ family transcriptional regulator
VPVGWPGEVTQFVGVRIPRSLLAAVDELAERERISRSDTIRAGILAHLEAVAPEVLARRRPRRPGTALND